MAGGRTPARQDTPGSRELRGILALWFCLGACAPPAGREPEDAGRGADDAGGVTATGGRMSTGTGGGAGGGTGGAKGGSGGRTDGAGGEKGRRGAGGGPGGAGGGPAGGAGGLPGGGASGTSDPRFLLGADITDAQSASAAAQDSLFQQLKQHGLNAIRARTFVDPKAADGYDRSNGFADLAHTVTWGKRIKSEGLFFLLDFHYSDNWADPGKQCVPVGWQGLTTIAELAKAVQDYTNGAVRALIAGGARPDMIQVGNEITPGMLLHRCDSGGQPMGNNPITGSTSNWANLGMLLKAGVQGIKDVDPSILIMLHIDRCNALDVSKVWIDNARKQGVAFDVFGESCYQRYQGDPNSVSNTVTGWRSTLSALASSYPALRFVAAEYGPMQREINDVLFALPGQQGLGTFNWEPDTEGDWNTGHALLLRQGNGYVVQPDLQLYDAMKTAYAARL